MYKWTYLHRGLWIITCPLLESSALGKMSQVTKWRSSSNTVFSSGIEGKKGNPTHQWSILSSLCCASAWPYSRTRYCLTQVTKWSLNVPLIIWCRRLGTMSWWISAWGKLFVNSCWTSHQWWAQTYKWCNIQQCPQWDHTCPKGLPAQTRLQVIPCDHKSASQHPHLDPSYPQYI